MAKQMTKSQIADNLAKKHSLTKKAAVEVDIEYSVFHRHAVRRTFSEPL